DREAQRILRESRIDDRTLALQAPMESGWVVTRMWSGAIITRGSDSNRTRTPLAVRPRAGIRLPADRRPVWYSYAIAPECPPMRYDLALFLSLNEEYRDKPIAPQPPSTDPVERARRASKRAAKLASSFELRRKRLLEIGCGRGEMLRELRISHGCTVVGADVRRYPQWDEIEGCTLVQGDLSDPEVARDIGTFDFIYSNSVWEHIRHPFAMLK